MAPKGCWHAVPILVFDNGWCLTCKNCDIKEYITLGDIRQMLWDKQTETELENRSNADV